MKTFVLLNHTLTEEQKTELGGEIFELPSELKKLWGQVPPDADYDGVQQHLKPILEWAENADRIVAQGDFTAFAVVLQWAKVPVLVATSKREVIEEDGGKKTAIFKHVRFRQVN